DHIVGSFVVRAGTQNDTSSTLTSRGIVMNAVVGDGVVIDHFGTFTENLNTIASVVMNVALRDQVVATGNVKAMVQLATAVMVHIEIDKFVVSPVRALAGEYPRMRRVPDFTINDSNVTCMIPLIFSRIGDFDDMVNDIRTVQHQSIQDDVLLRSVIERKDSIN